jgi:glycosyltransferase involved in cell wall biosynthesis
VSPIPPEGRIRVVHIITLLELGGAQQNTLHTVKALDRNRFDAVLIAGKGGYLDDEALSIPDAEVHLLEELVRPIHPWKDMRALFKLKKILKGLKAGGLPMIVQTHSGKAGVLGRAAARFVGVEGVIHHIHSLSFPKLKGGVFARVGRLMERIVDPWTDGFISVSRANIEDGNEIGLYRDGVKEVIRSGFDTRAFSRSGLDKADARKALGLEVDAPVAGMIACFKPQKNPLGFIRICAEVLKEEPRARFIVAGDGVLRPRMERLALELGVDRRIELLGWRRDIPLLLKAMDALVLPSLWEGLPRVVVQAFLSGTPVVATPVDGVPEVVRDGENGFLVRPRDDREAARKILEIFRTNGQCLNPGPQAEEFEEAFHQDRMVEQQEAFYLRLYRDR